MFLLRRAAVRALSNPSTSLITKPRSITTFSPASFRIRQQPSIGLTFQRRFASDDAEKAYKETLAPKSESTEETSPENFAQTAGEAPVTETTPESTTTEKASSAVSSATEYVKEKASDALETVGLGGAASAVAASKPFGSSFAESLKPNKVVYVGNLFFEVSEDQLRRVFSRFGEVSDVRLVTDGKGLSRGFGYVTMQSVEDATTAIENLNQQVFEGRRMNVQYHIERERPARAHVPRTPSNPSKTLFIGNMSFEMSDKDLNDLFRDIRNVMDVRVAIDRRTGQPRGFAHADFIDVKSAEQAKGVLEGKEIYGRKLRVDFSGHSAQTRTAPQ